MKVCKSLPEVAFNIYNKFEHVSLNEKPYHGINDIINIINKRINFSSHISKGTYSMLESLIINGISIDTIMY